jgi:hypothetical protein
VQHAGDLLADAAARAGDQGDLALERAQPVGDLAAECGPGVVPMRTTWPETYADFGDSRKARVDRAPPSAPSAT